jgi:hypothetical protein
VASQKSSGGILKLVAPVPPTAPAFLVGDRTGVMRPKRNRAQEIAMQLETQRLRLEELRLRASEREKDRDIVRFRIEERRRLKEDMADRNLREREDANIETEAEAAVRRVKERLAAGGGKPPQAAEPSPQTERDRQIAEEIRQAMEGTFAAK